MHTNLAKKWNKILIFLLLSFIFFLLRVDTYKEVFKYPFLNLIDPDSYYHLRRILFTIMNYPKMLIFDKFLSYPYGDYSPWPPLFDFLSATIALPFSTPEKILPWLNLLYFYIAFAIIFLFLLKTQGLLIAFIASIFIAFSGILKIYTSFGRLDHHALELLIITVLSISFLVYYATGKIKWLLVFTLSLFLSFLNWPGALIYTIPIILFSTFQILKKNEPPYLAKGCFVAFHATAIGIAIYLKMTKTIDFPPYSFKFLSGFQRDFCFVTSILFFTVHLAKKKFLKPLLIWTINLTVIFIFFKNFFYEIFHGISFIGKYEHVLATAEEASPIFFSSYYDFIGELKRNTFLFTPFFYLLPFVFYYHVKKRLTAFLMFYTSFFFVLTTFQLRFGYFFMLGYAIMLANFLETSLKKINIYLILIIAVSLSFISFNISHKNAKERFTDPEIMESMFFLRNQTVMKELFEEHETPYGVMASWELGHHIIQIANRPAIAHPFITVAIHNGVDDFFNIFFAKDEKTVLNIMDKTNSRYLMLLPPYDSIITDWDTKRWGKNPYVKDGKLIETARELFLYNLYTVYGNWINSFSNYTGLRLVFESSKGNVKIFERVKGCKIVLKNKKGYVLKISINFNGKSFFYTSQGYNTKDGQIFISPYSTENIYPIKVNFIQVEKDGKKTFLNISDDHVQNGRIIYLTF